MAGCRGKQVELVSQWGRGFIDWLDRLDDEGLTAIWKIFSFGCTGGDDIACMHNISGAVRWPLKMHTESQRTACEPCLRWKYPRWDRRAREMRRAVDANCRDVP